MLPKQAIKEFQQLYKTELHINLEYKQAEVKANDFIRLFHLITQPNTPIQPQH